MDDFFDLSVEKSFQSRNADTTPSYTTTAPRELLRDPRFLQDLREHYRSQGLMIGAATDEDLIEKFYSDRNWADLNTVSAANDAMEAMGAGVDERSRARRLQEAWRALPNFYEDGGRGFMEMAKDVVPAIVMDPVNLIGGAASKPAAIGATAAARAAGRTAAEAGSAGLRAGVSRAALTEGAVSGLAEGGFDAITQSRDIALGLQDEYSAGQTALATGLGATIGGVAGGLAGIPGAFAGVRGGEEVYQNLRNLGLPDEVIADLTPTQITRMVSDPNALGEFVSSNSVDMRGQRAADVPFGNETPEPATTQEGVTQLGDRFDSLIQAQRGYIDRMRAEGVDADVVSEYTRELSRLVNLQSMPARLEREYLEITKLAESGVPSKQQEAERRRLLFEQDYADFRQIISSEASEDYDAVLARLEASKAEAEQEETQATKPSKAKTKKEKVAAQQAATPEATPAEAPAEAPTETPAAAPAETPAEAPTEQAAAPTEQVQDVELDPTPDEASRFENKNAGVFSDAAQKYLEKQGITLDPALVPGSGRTGMITYRDVETYVKENNVQPDAEAKAAKKVAKENPVAEVTKAARKEALLNGVDYRSVAETASKTKSKPVKAVRSEIKQRKDAPKVDKYVADLATKLDELMGRAADADIDDLTEAKSVIMGWAKEEGIDTDDLDILFDDFITNTRKEGLLEDDIEIEMDLTKGEEARAQRISKASIAGGVDPDVAIRMARIEVFSNRGESVAASPRGSSTKWEKAGELTTAGRTAEGKIQSFLRRGMPIAKGSDYTIAGAPFPTAATFEFDEALIRAMAKDGPDIVAFKATGNEKVITSGGGENRVPRGTIAYADGVTGKAYESPEMAMAMRPEGMKKGESITADELGEGKISPAVAAQKAKTKRAAEDLTPIPAAQRGDGLLMVRSKTDPDDVRMMSPSQAAAGKTMQDIIGKKRKVEEFDIKYAPANLHTSSKPKLRTLWDRIEAPDENLQGAIIKNAMDTSPEADAPPPRSFESVATQKVAPLTAEEARSLSRSKVAVFSEGQEPTVRDLMRLRMRVEIASWKEVRSIGGIDQIADTLATVNRILSVAVPEGVAMPNAQRAETVTRVRDIFGRHAPEEAAFVANLIEKRLGGDRSIAPTIAESRQGSNFLTDFDEPEGAQLIRINPNSSTITPGTVALTHEIAHWAYFNILTDADRADFWNSMRKYADGDAKTLMEALPVINKMPIGDGKTASVNSGLSPQELFARQFETWVLRNAEDTPVSDPSYWQKIGRYFKAIFDRYFRDAKIDPDLEPLFAKILPPEEEALFRGGVDISPQTDAGKQYAKRLVEMHAIRDELEDAISRGSHDGILNGYRELVSFYFSLIGDKREKTGPFMPSKRFLKIIRNRIADFDEIMGTSLSSGEATPADLLDIGSGGVMSGDVADRIEVLADFYENGYLGKFQPEGGIPVGIKPEQTSPKVLMDNMTAAMIALYKKAEGTGKLPAGIKPRYKPNPNKVSKGAKKAAIKIERETHKDFRSAMEAVKAKEPKAKSPSAGAISEDLKAKPIHALRMAYKRDAETEMGQHIARELLRKMRAEDLPKTKVKVSRETMEASNKSLDAMYLDALYRGDKKLTSETYYEIRRRSQNKATRLSKATTVESIDAIAREREDSIGLPDSNGIPPAARASVREFLSYMTHRDPDVEYTLRTMAYRMLNLMGRTAKATVEDANLMTAHDVARLAARNQSVAGSAVFADFRAPEFSSLRRDLRRMAVGLTKGESDPVDMMHEIGHVIVRSGSLPAAELSAIHAAFDAATDAIKDRVTKAYGPRYADLDARRRNELLAEEWFAENLAKYMAERVARGDIYEQLANGSFQEVELRGRFDRAIDRVVEYVAYVVNGLIGRNDVKQTFRRLMFYGDMLAEQPKAPLADSRFKNKAVPPELAALYARDAYINAPDPQKERAKAFVAKGYGADADGNPVAFYHGTPNGMALNSNANPVVKISAQGNYGPGFYVSANPRPAEEVYSLGTPEALVRAMRRANPDASEEQVLDFMELAENLGDTRKALAAARLEYSMQLDSMADVDEITFEIATEDLDAIRRRIDRLLDEEDAMVGEIIASGADFQPDVLPVYIRMTNPVDFRESAVFNDNDRFLQATLSDVIGKPMPAPDREMNGREAYTWLVSSISRERGLSQMQAQSMLNTHLQKSGHDGLLTTHRNTVSLEGMAGEGEFSYAGEIVSYDAPVLFTGNNVKHVDAALYDETSPYLYNRTEALVPRDLNAALAVSMSDGTLNSIDDIHVASIGEEIDRGGDPSLTSALMSMASGRKPKEKEIVAMVRRGPKGWIMSQSEQMSAMGMNWLAGWYKQVFSDVNQRLGNKYMPIQSALRALPDADSTPRSWLRRATGGIGQEQPKSYTRIVRALRHGDGSRQEAALTNQERAIYQQIRRTFAGEREDLVAQGVFMGNRKNYLPQIWSKSVIEKDPEGFKSAMAQYHVIEQTKLGQSPKMEESQAFADRMFMRLTGDDSDGVFIPLAGGSRDPQSDSIDFTRMIELDKHPEAMRALEKYLENDLEGILVKYLEGTSRRLAHIEKMGVSSHGFYDYLTVIDQGARGIAHLLSTNKMFSKEFGALGLDAKADTFVLKDVVVMPFHNRPGEAEKFAQRLVEATKTRGTAEARRMLMEVAPKDVRGKTPLAYKRRADAIIGALADFKGERPGKSNPDFNADLNWLEQAMNVAMRKRIKGSSRTAIRASAAARTFNNISLLSYTVLSSMGDVVLPLIRSGNMQAFLKAQARFASDPEYREAMARTGVAIETVVHQHMIDLFGGVDGKVSNAFFNATLLTPWTDLNRKIAAAVGFEAISTEQKRARAAYKPGLPYSKQPASFRKSARFLNAYGLSDFLPGGSREGETLSNMALLNEDRAVRQGVIRFADTAVFAPNADDVPLWAQTPWGAVIAQLKTFPLMMTRMTGHVLREANKGNVTPLLYLATFGPASGAAALAIKDITQMRGGDDGTDAEVRKRNILKFMGHDKDIHGDEHDFLGWYAEGMLMMGGLGIIGDVLHGIGSQVENGDYGKVRIASTIGGPTIGAGFAAVTGMSGIQEAIFDNTDSNYKERAAARELATRIPLVGGNRAARESIVDMIAGESTSDDRAGSWGTSFVKAWE